MILGANESAAGGLHLAFERCARDGADALQLFTRSSRQWKARPLDEEAVRAFRSAHAGYRTPRIPTAAHASYLINLAAPDGELYAKSEATLGEECERAERLGVGQVIVHPGATMDAPVAEGLERAAAALRRICHALGRGARVRLLLELTAGQGSSIGCSFEQLAELLDRGGGDARLGVCLDTQHMYAVGIDWATEEGYGRAFDDFDRVIGLPRLEAFHLNDSKKPLGARVDRHERIGDGTIGLAPFARLLRDARFAALPGYLETPPLPDGGDSYAQGLARLRSLLDDRRRPARRR
jgi:deoxyribonuclease-4